MLGWENKTEGETPLREVNEILRFNMLKLKQDQQNAQEYHLRNEFLMRRILTIPLGISGN